MTYLRQVLAPELRPGDLVICDTLACHKVAGEAAAVAACTPAHCRGIFRHAHDATA